MRVSFQVLLLMLMLTGCNSGNPWHPYPYINAQPNDVPSPKPSSSDKSIFEKYGISPEFKEEKNYNDYDDRENESYNPYDVYSDTDAYDNESSIKRQDMKDERSIAEKPIQSKEAILKKINQIDNILQSTSSPNNSSNKDNKKNIGNNQ